MAYTISSDAFQFLSFNALIVSSTRLARTYQRTRNCTDLENGSHVFESDLSRGGPTVSSHGREYGGVTSMLATHCRV